MRRTCHSWTKAEGCGNVMSRSPLSDVGRMREKRGDIIYPSTPLFSIRHGMAIHFTSPSSSLLARYFSKVLNYLNKAIKNRRHVPSPVLKDLGTSPHVPC